MGYSKAAAVIEHYGSVSFNATGAADIIPLYDNGPALAMAAQALVAVGIWFLFLFTYMKQDMTSTGLNMYPI